MKGIPFARLVEQYEYDLRSLFHASSILSREGLMDLATSQRFKSAAEMVARRMVATVQVSSARNWREAAMKSTQARKIFQSLQAELAGSRESKAMERLIRENAKLIRSVPIDIARHIARIAKEEQGRGVRSKELAARIREIAPALTVGKLKLIARTEISRAETNVTRVRAEEIGIEWGIWQTSDDERVRASHKNLNGVLVRFTDPPQPEHLIGLRSTLGPGLPGTFPNCRCLLLPLVSLDEVSWSHRVYRNGRITMMTRVGFQRIAQIPQAA